MERWKGGKEDGAPAFRVGLKRHLDVWDFENNLAQASQSLVFLVRLLIHKYRSTPLALLFATGPDSTTPLHKNNPVRWE
jgi:hypothetical protein